MKAMRADSSVKNGELFQGLSVGAAPKGALSASIGLHGVLLLFLVLVPLLAPQKLKVTYNTTMLAPPPDSPRQPETAPLKLRPPRPRPRSVEPRRELTAELLPPPTAAVIIQEPELRIREDIPKPAPVALATPVALPILEPGPMPAIAPPKPRVTTDVFSSTTSNPVIAVPVRTTEAAGFGDAKSIREGGRTTQIASAAGFGDVEGGREIRRAVERGGAGVVSGFDVAVLRQTRGDRGAVLKAGFASSSDGPRLAASNRQKAAETKNERPVEILVKPRPDYTEEARRLRVEGDVLLRVLFTARGDVRVLEVIRGLGNGLDENAIEAAAQIRFKPAERGGQAVDSMATVHIVFQLAY